MCKYILNCSVLVSLGSQEWRRGKASFKKKAGISTDNKTEEHNKIMTTNDIEKRNLDPGTQDGDLREIIKRMDKVIFCLFFC